MLLILTIAPPRLWSIAQRANARAALSAPMALTAKNRAASPASASISGRTANKAALLTRMSTAPSRATVVAINRSQSEASATSVGTGRTVDPHSPSIVSAACVSVSLVRPAMATRAPCRAKARAIAWPIPLAPPVTIATLPSNSCSLPPDADPITTLPTRRQAIDWKRRASALMCLAVSMSRSVIFMPASWVQNENDTMLYELWNSG